MKAMYTPMGMTINGLPLYKKHQSGELTRMQAVDLRIGEDFNYRKDEGAERYIVEEIWLARTPKAKAQKCKDTVSVGVGYKRRPCRSYAHPGYDGYCQAHWQSVIKERIIAVGEFLRAKDGGLFDKIIAKARDAGKHIR